MGVELLGKATLWRENSVLLVQLNDRHEVSLFLLATRPDLATKGATTPRCCVNGSATSRCSASTSTPS